MASYLRPRRGKAATATSTLTASAPLKRGEIFFEVPTGGVGTGQGKLKMGDGSSAYSALKYFLSLDDGTVAFTNKTSADPTNNSTYLGNVIPTNSLATVLTNVKQLLVNYNSQITTLNNDLIVSGTSHIRFGIDSNGNYGYKKVGADTIYPFSSGLSDLGYVLIDSTKYTACNGTTYSSASFPKNGYVTEGIPYTVTINSSASNSSIFPYWIVDVTDYAGLYVNVTLGSTTVSGVLDIFSKTGNWYIVVGLTHTTTNQSLVDMVISSTINPLDVTYYCRLTSWISALTLTINKLILIKK